MAYLNELTDEGLVKAVFIDYMGTTEDEIVTRLILDMEAQIELRDDPAVLRDLIHSHWVNAPVFPDAADDLEQALELVFN